MQFNGGYGDYDPEYDSDYDPEYHNEADNEIDPETELDIDPEYDSDQSIIRTEVYDQEGNHKGSYIGVIQEIEPESIDDLVDETDNEIDDELSPEERDELQESPKEVWDEIEAHHRGPGSKHEHKGNNRGIRELTDEEFERIYPEKGHRVFWGSNGKGGLPRNNEHKNDIEEYLEEMEKFDEEQKKKEKFKKQWRDES